MYVAGVEVAEPHLVRDFGDYVKCYQLEFLYHFLVAVDGVEDLWGVDGDYFARDSFIAFAHW